MIHISNNHTFPFCLVLKLYYYTFSYLPQYQRKVDGKSNVQKPVKMNDNKCRRLNYVPDYLGAYILTPAHYPSAKPPNMKKRCSIRDALTRGLSPGVVVPTLPPGGVLSDKTAPTQVHMVRWGICAESAKPWT